MKNFASVWAVLVVACAWLLGVEGEVLFTLSEKELKSSQIWKDQKLNLFLVQQGSSVVPTELTEFMAERIGTASLPAAIVKVTCKETSRVDDRCPLFAEHGALVRRSGTKSLVGVDLPSGNLEGSVSVLEEMIVVAQVSNHASLKGYLSKHSESFLVLAKHTGTEEYLSLLEAYLVHQPSLPLIVTSHSTSVPLAHRPPHTTEDTPLYLFNIRDHGSQWYRLLRQDQQEEFVFRARYPAIVHYGDNKNVIKEFRNKNMNLAVFFPGPDKDIEELATKIATFVYLSYIIIIADRVDSDLARRYSVTQEIPMVVIFPNGDEKKMVMNTLDDHAETLEEQVFGMSNNLLSFSREGSVLSVLQDEAGDGASHQGAEEQQVPSISLTDMSGIHLILKRNRNDVVVSFCKKGAERCPDDIYFTLESAQIVVSKAKLNISFHFFVVECDSVTDVHPYQLNQLPGYALYNQSTGQWVAGTGNVNNHMDILLLIVQETGHKELLTIPLDDHPDLSASITLSSIKKDDDTYGRLGVTLPSPSLPAELIFTSENFDERIKQAAKTAVVFYISWAVETKVLLHHLLTAWKRLDTSSSVQLGSVDCHAHTTTCSRFNVTVLPTVLLFSPPPSPPTTPTLGAIDSTHLLQALGQGVEPPAGLREVSPASLPVLLKNSLATPLVLWCAESRVTELSTVFAETIQNEKYSETSFGWINSTAHSQLLHTAFSLQTDQFPSVLAVELGQGNVYKMEKIQPDTFRDKLKEFLDLLKDGSLQPSSHLAQKEWPPLNPPYTFPSVPRDMEGDFSEGRGVEGRGEERREYEYFEDMDINSIPFDEAPQFNHHEHIDNSQVEYNRDEL